MRVIVCGGRNLVGPSHVNAIETVLLDFEKVYGQIERLATGFASGVDQIALDWANRNKISTGVYPADWVAEGRAAGPIRNERMLRSEKPDMVIAFPGGRGTVNMVEIAATAGVPVFKVNPLTFEIVKLRWAVMRNMLERITR